jgi:hypothetical protein
MQHRVLGLVALVLSAGCTSSTAPTTLSVQLQSSPVQLGAPVPYTLANGSEDAVFVPSCCGRAVVLVDRSVGGRWEAYNGGFCQANCMMTPIRIAPHTSVTGSLSVSDTGRFRLRIEVAASLRGQPSWTTTSDAFDVR